MVYGGMMPISPKPHQARSAQRSMRSESLQPWYQTPTWKRLRDVIIERDHYLCQECKRDGKLTTVLKHAKQSESHKTGHVDHIKPHNGIWELFVDELNLETLCKPCHSRKTMIETQGVA